jgi:hypothetical protein
MATPTAAKKHTVKNDAMEALTLIKRLFPAPHSELVWGGEGCFLLVRNEGKGRRKYEIYFNFLFTDFHLHWPPNSLNDLLFKNQGFHNLAAW